MEVGNISEACGLDRRGNNTKDNNKYLPYAHLVPAPVLAASVYYFSILTGALQGRFYDYSNFTDEKN